MIWNGNNVNRFFACILLTLFVGCLIDMSLRYILKKQVPRTVHIGIIVTVVFLYLYGFTSNALRCILLCEFLIVAGVWDATTYEIPNFLHFLIAMVGLIDFQLIPALLGFIMVPLPFLIAAIKTNKIGGGDVKLMAVCGFVLGVTDGIWMMILGLFMALLWNTVFKRGEKSVPLVPYLAFGCFMVMIL